MSVEALLTNYLFIGPLLEQRLREQIGEGIPVEGIEAMSQARDAQEKRAVVLYVMWGGDRFNTSEGGRAAGGASQLMHQRWIVFVRVENASTVNKDARSERAGPLLSAVHKAIAGWKPEGSYRTMVRTQGPGPDYQATSGLYPLAFEIQLAL